MTLPIIWLLLACGPRDEPLPAAIELHCSTSSASPETAIVGISDPNTVDPAVVDLIAATGVRWVRAEFHWSVIQPDPDGPLDFSTYDAMVQRFSSKGIQVVGILTYVPPAFERDWPAIETAFRAFSAATVERYAAQGVHHWEVFNEPNLTGYGWLSEGDDAYQNLPNYVRLLGIANEVIREHDPDATIVLGGIASEQHRGLSVEQTMEIVYGYGARDCFDVFAFHPYGYQNQFVEARARVQDVLDAGGDSNKPVWFNEYGWTDQPSMDQAVNNTAATNPMMAVFAQKHVADALFWFSAKDYSGRASAPTFGLADFELVKRPSFDTFRDLVSSAP